MQKEQLLELRSKIVASAQELALNGSGSVNDRLQILLSVVRAGDANLDVLSKAFELANTVDGDDEKLTALMDVLYEVDAKLTNEDTPTEQEGSSNNEQPEQEHHF